MILGIDIGGTSCKVGLLEKNGIIRLRTSIPTADVTPSDTILMRLKTQLPDFLSEKEAADLLSASPLEGLAVSAAGQIDTHLGKVIGTNGRIPGYEGSELKRELEDTFHVPVWVLNDANAALLGEVFLGSARDKKDVLMVTLGTGVGGGIMTGGRLLEGKRGIAGEIGHFTLYQDGDLCPCGKRGCFELYASTSALVKKARLVSSEDVPDGQTVFEKAKTGDPKMQSAINDWLDDVSAGISSLLHIFDPELVLIGGGVSAQEELLMVPLTEKLAKTTMPRFMEDAKVKAASLGNDAGLMGALSFWLKKEKSGT